jgi:hypothetical protein
MDELMQQQPLMEQQLFEDDEHLAEGLNKEELQQLVISDSLFQ